MNRVKNIIRKGFTTIPNALINDDSLTDRARFLFCYMASKPDDWKFYQQPLCKSLGYSIDTLRKYLDELLQSGWITRELIRNEGKFDSFTYDLLPEPCRKNTDTVKSRDGILPTRKKSALLNKDLEQKKTETKKERENTPAQPEIKQTLIDRIEKIQEANPGLPANDYRVLACIQEVGEYFKQYPAVKQTITNHLQYRNELGNKGPDGRNFFTIEVEMWIRHNKENTLILSDPTRYISGGRGSLMSWLGWWDKEQAKKRRELKKDTGVYQAPKNLFG